MANYGKGACYERELMDILTKKGFSVSRIAGSGKAKTQDPDLIAGNGKLIIAIECKYSKTKYKTIKKEQANDLFYYSKRFGAKPILAFRFSRTPWKFIIMNNETKNNINIKKTDKLLTLKELIGE